MFPPGPLSCVDDLLLAPRLAGDGDLVAIIDAPDQDAVTVAAITDLETPAEATNRCVHTSATAISNA